MILFRLSHIKLFLNIDKKKISFVIQHFNTFIPFIYTTLNKSIYTEKIVVLCSLYYNVAFCSIKVLDSEIQRKCIGLDF